MPYDRAKAVEYAHLWALGRNPKYYDFAAIGGDCTNFISQCILAGCGKMNYTPVTGWYYNSLSSRSAAWAGVQFLYNFLTANKGAGPYGYDAPLAKARLGDVIQLCFDAQAFTHSVFVVSAPELPAPDSILVASHNHDCDSRPLDTYSYARYRLIHIEGARG
ncbi:MAG: amidase domain-containing protein [Oscillospiraceae bacterium]|jgi:hypothetical protein|nr:amidase domain-containing protein [Oscillospiraceae bacterium]